MPTATLQHPYNLTCPQQHYNTHNLPWRQVHSKTTSIFPGLWLAPPETTRPKNGHSGVKLTFCFTEQWVIIRFGFPDMTSEKYAHYWDWNVERFVLRYCVGRSLSIVYWWMNEYWRSVRRCNDTCWTVQYSYWLRENCQLLVRCCWGWVLLHFGAESLACNRKLVTTADSFLWNLL